MPVNLKKDYIWNTIGVLAQNAISPFLLVIVTRLNGINDSGLFSFAFSVAIIFWAIGMWGGRTYQVSDTKGVFKQQSYILVRLILAVVMIIGSVIFSVINQYDSTKTSIIIALVLLKVLESIADALYGVLQTNNKLYIAGKSLFIKAFLGIFLFVMIDAITSNLLIGTYALIVANLIVLIIYDIPRTVKIAKFDTLISHRELYFKEAIAIIRVCLPVFMISFLAAFSLNIPRYFIDLYHTNEIGFFGIIAMPVTLVVLLMTFILQPNIVAISEHLHNKQYDRFVQTIHTIIKITVGVGVLILLVVYLLGSELLSFVFGVDFSAYRYALLIITTGALASAMVAIYVTILTVMRRIRAQMYILLSTNIVLLIACVYSIEHYGTIGGVSLFTVTNIAQAALFDTVFKKYVRKLRVEKKA